MNLGNNFLITEMDRTVHKCTAKLINFSFYCRKLSVGQSITSQIFEMTLPHIGKSTWTLILFPNGQYEFERDDGQMSVYLKLVACEHENEQMHVDVKFFLDSEEIFNKVLISSTFHYQNTRTRWVGTKLISKSDLKTQASCGYLIRSNNLVIGFRMIHPVVLKADSAAILSCPSEEIQAKKKKTWSDTPMYSNSSVIDIYRPSETSTSPSSLHSLKVGLSTDKSHSVSHESIPDSISTRQRKKSGKKRRLFFCW